VGRDDGEVESRCPSSIASTPDLHARMESLLFDGVVPVVDGSVTFDPRRPGLGLTLRTREADHLAA